jgi:hypothetical protein
MSAFSLVILAADSLQSAPNQPFGKAKSMSDGNCNDRVVGSDTIKTFKCSSVVGAIADIFDE